MSQLVQTLTDKGFTLLDRLDHRELIPFVQRYLKKRNTVTVLYILLNAALFLALLVRMVLLLKSGQAGKSEVLLHLSWGMALAFALIPLHEYIHVLAYRSQGARETSYDVHWRKFYFLAVAHGFVAGQRQFRIVALAPVAVITLAGLLAMPLTGASWQLTMLSMLLIHAAFSAGDFGLLSYFHEHRHLEVVTFDDRDQKLSYFLGRSRTAPAEA
jgi:hypothetical protein